MVEGWLVDGLELLQDGSSIMVGQAQNLCLMMLVLAVTVPFGDGLPIPEEQPPSNALEGHAGLQEAEREYQMTSQVMSLRPAQRAHKPLV